MNFVDPSGTIAETVFDVASIGMGIHSISNWNSSTSLFDKVLDVSGLAFDSAATALPFVPGGVGATLKMERATETTSDVIKVIGRQVDSDVAKAWKNHDVLDIPDWSMEKNMKWVNDGIKNKQTFYTASPEAVNMIQKSGMYRGEPTVFARELDQLKGAGYNKSGDYYYPPSN